MAAKKRRKVSSKRAVLKASPKRRRKSAKRGLSGSPKEHESSRKLNRTHAVANSKRVKREAKRGQCYDAMQYLVQAAEASGGASTDATYSRGHGSGNQVVMSAANTFADYCIPHLPAKELLKLRRDTLKKGRK